MAVEIVLSGGTVPGGFTVTASTNNGTAALQFVATANVDYTAISQVLNFAGNPGEIQTLTVQTTEDGDELRAGRTSQYPSPV